MRRRPLRSWRIPSGSRALFRRPESLPTCDRNNSPSMRACCRRTSTSSSRLSEEQSHRGNVRRWGERCAGTQASANRYRRLDRHGCGQIRGRHGAHQAGSRGNRCSRQRRAPDLPAHPHLHVEFHYEKDCAGIVLGRGVDHDRTRDSHAHADGHHHDHGRLSRHVFDHGSRAGLAEAPMRGKYAASLSPAR
jgi:hypothetical protein